jgi:acyl-CoA-binding protein
LLEYINHSSQLSDNICLDDSGQQIDCFQQIIEQIEEEQQQQEEDDEQTIYECELTDSCGPACALLDPECPPGQPELWFTYPEFGTVGRYLEANLDAIGHLN